MKKGDKLRVIVRKGHPLLHRAGLREGQVVKYYGPWTNTTIEVDDGTGDCWAISAEAVEEVR